MVATTLLWLQSGGCGGCTMSLLNAEHPCLNDRWQDAAIQLLWHPSWSEATGREFLDIITACVTEKQPLDILCVEGAVMTGPNGSGKFHLLAGTGKPMMQWIEALAKRARFVVAVGTCAAFGGITASGNAARFHDVTGLQFQGDLRGGLLPADFRSAAGLPVINIAGCPTHPEWVLTTLDALATGRLSETDLDALHRPRFYAEHLVHHGCPRNEYYEFKASAEKLSDLGCLMEHLGCLGTQAHADCNLRPWNGQGSCLRGGYPCIACTEPGFEEPGHPFTQTPKIGGIPVGLPTDMPKAWFVALSALAKSATPKRVRANATAERVLIPPTIKKRTARS